MPLGFSRQWGLDHLYGRNPFTLSGGEQAVLAVACGIFLNPTRLAIDCAFEQIDLDFRNETMKLLERPDVTTSVALADNRLGEYDFSPSEWHMIDLKSGARPAYGSLPAIQPDRASRKPVPGIVIDFEDLSFQYSKGVDVLRNAQMHLEPGAIHLLSGKNGAGKSTLAKLLAGVIRPKSGRIMFDRRVEQPWKSPGAVVAYHFQNPDVQLFATTVEEELTLGLHTSAAGERGRCARPLDRSVPVAHGTGRASARPTFCPSQADSDGGDACHAGVMVYSRRTHSRTGRRVDSYNSNDAERAGEKWAGA